MSNPTLSLEQSQKLQQRLSQQQLQFVRLLELNAPEAEERVRQELEANPALEELPGTESGQAETTASGAEETPSWNPHWGSRQGGMGAEIPTPADQPSLYEHLRRQLDEKDLSPQVRRTAEYLIGNLDSNGYLRRPLRQAILDMALGGAQEPTDDEAQEALDALRGLEPPGVGAASLRDCLTMQLERQPASQQRDDALRILNEQFEEFTLKHNDRLASLLRISPLRVEKAIRTIVSLNPKPGAQFESREQASANYLVPDFILEQTDRGMVISLNNRIPELAIQASFAQAVESFKGKRGAALPKGHEFVVSRVADARDFIRLLSQRQHTLLTVASAILAIQREYFESRDLYKLRPMVIRDISQLTGLDASAISRATAGKYLQTPWGVFPMRFFFSDTVGSNGSDTEALTNRKLEAEIRKIVDSENKARPLSDDKIQKALQDNGYDVSRRTVAKYRDRLSIPVARLRKR